MKISLVWPSGFDTDYVLPLPLAYLKSNIDPKHNVQVIDCSFLRINSESNQFKEMVKEFMPKVLGVSCWSITYQEAMNVLRETKKINKNIITVIGGVHATVCSDDIIQSEFVDYVFRGESEMSFQTFIEQVENKTYNFSKVDGLTYRVNGEIKNNPINLMKQLDKIKLPDYEAINLMGYIESGYRLYTKEKMNAPVWFTRGCPFNCNFCTASIMNGTVVRKHSIPYMLNWIKQMEKIGIKQINIIDDNFTFDVEKTKEFCNEIIRTNTNVKFGNPNGVRAERTDKKLFELMKAAGWESVIFAPESGSIRTLNNMGKNINLDVIPQKIKDARHIGLKIYGFFIVGYPGETKYDIEKTVKFLRSCKFNFFFLNNFQPLPGTKIYNDLVSNGEIAKNTYPKNYSSGERAYTPPALNDFDFPRLILKEYLHLALTNPSNIPHMVGVIGFRMMFKKIYSNMTNMRGKWATSEHLERIRKKVENA